MVANQGLRAVFGWDEPAGCASALLRLTDTAGDPCGLAKEASHAFSSVSERNCERK